MVIIILAVVTATPLPLGRAALESDARTQFSPNRAFNATVSYEPRPTDFVPLARFELRDSSGRLRYSRPGDGITALEISDQGAVVGAEFDGPVSGRARLHFLDSAGVDVGTAEVGFYGQRAFSADGSVFCVNDGLEGVRVFSAGGRELQRLGPANRFAVSAAGRQVALARDDSLVLFRDGAEQGRVGLPTPFVRDLSFSGDGVRVGYVERHALRVFRTGDLTEVLTWRPAADDPEPVSLDILGPDGLVLVGLGKAGGRQAAVLLAADGTEFWREETTRERWNAQTPRVRFGPGRTFVVESVDELKTWLLEEE